MGNAGRPRLGPGLGGWKGVFQAGKRDAGWSPQGALCGSGCVWREGVSVFLKEGQGEDGLMH